MEQENLEQTHVPSQSSLSEKTDLHIVSVQEKAVIQHKVARLAVISLAFLLVFSIAAGMYWFMQNKAILQQASKHATSTKLTVVTPIPATNDQNSQELMINMHALPLGDGKVSTSPRIGYIYSCNTEFRQGGADHAGSWIDGDTWDAGEKVSVEGNVTWSTATFTIATQGTTRVLTGNELPVNSATGIFPISSSDPAYQYDRNPNAISPHTLSATLPINPVLGTPQCVPMGIIGIALNGVPIFNGLDDGGRDAVAHEIQDSCNGHPQQTGVYHYHGPSSCIPGADKPNTLVGYAFDGFGIYSDIDTNGNQYTNSDLDVCHGTTSQINWDGKNVVMYHYVMTQEYPYTIGCFRGSKIVHIATNDQQSNSSSVSPSASESTFVARNGYHPPPGVNGY